MIVFRRLNGNAVAINPDLIERVEATPDTVLTLVDDKKFLVAETMDEVIRAITDYRSYVIARSTDLNVVDRYHHPTLHVVPNELVVAASPDGSSPDAGSGELEPDEIEYHEPPTTPVIELINRPDQDPEHR